MPHTGTAMMCITILLVPRHNSSNTYVYTHHIHNKEGNSVPYTPAHIKLTSDVSEDSVSLPNPPCWP